MTNRHSPFTWLIPLLVLLAPLNAGAQLVLLSVQPGTEEAVSSPFTVPTVAAGDYADTRFRVRNTAAASITVQKLTVDGAGFKLRSFPDLPHILAPGSSFDFFVRFQPASHGFYSAALALNGATSILLGEALAAAVLTVEQETGIELIAANGAVNFGAIERGGRTVRRMALENRSPRQIAVSSLRISGSGFSGLDNVEPFVLDAGQTFLFEVIFEPLKAGLHEGELWVDQRRFLLQGFALTPPLPRPAIAIDPAAPASGQQPKVSIRLAEPSRASGTGQLRLEFRPSMQGPDDAAVQFVTGGRTAAFTVEEGDSTGRFGAEQDIRIQSGTTAGTLLFTVQLGQHRETLTVSIPPAPVVFESVRARRSTSGVEVEVTGYDNTRSASEVLFRFHGRDGQTIGGGPAPLDAAADFRKYFENAPAGGAFLLKAVFPVTGDARQIASVEVEIRNSAGPGRSARTTFE